MEFADALHQLRMGKTVSRPGWHSGCFLALAHTFGADPFLALYSDVTRPVEWKPETRELLAADWYLYDPAKPVAAAPGTPGQDSAQPDSAEPEGDKPDERGPFRITADGPRLAAQWDLAATADVLWSKLGLTRGKITEMVAEFSETLLDESGFAAMLLRLVDSAGGE